MKSVYVFLLFALVNTSSYSQEFLLEGGKSITSFDFRDVLSNSLENLQPTSQSYINVGYRGKLFTKAIYFLGGFGIHTYGAIGSQPEFNNFLEWEATYLSFYGGIDVEIFKINKVSFHAKGTVSPEILIQGTQTFNNSVFDILGEEDFDTPFVFLRGAASLEYEISENLRAFFQFRIGSGSQINNSDTGADLKYSSQDFGLGLVI